jgi:hypothetical protein
LFKEVLIIFVLLGLLPIGIFCADECLKNHPEEACVKKSNNISLLTYKSHQAKSGKLINYPEEKLNNYLNPYIEVGVGGINDFSYKSNLVITGDLFLPFFSRLKNQVVFINLRTFDPSGSSFTGNAQLGYRHLFFRSPNHREEQKHLIGVYGSFDRTRTNYQHYFNQLTFGVEYWLNETFMGANIYLPIGSKKRLISERLTITDTFLITDRLYEEACRGFDATLGYTLTENLTGYVGGFYYNGYESNKIIRGAKIQLEYSFPPFTERLLGIFDNAKLRVGVKKAFMAKGTEAFIELKLRIGLTRNPPKLSSFESHLIDLVRREQSVLTVLNQVREVKKIISSFEETLPAPSPPPSDDESQKRSLKESEKAKKADSEQPPYSGGEGPPKPPDVPPPDLPPPPPHDGNNPDEPNIQPPPGGNGGNIPGQHHPQLPPGGNGGGNPDQHHPEPPPGGNGGNNPDQHHPQPPPGGNGGDNPAQHHPEPQPGGNAGDHLGQDHRQQSPEEGRGDNNAPNLHLLAQTNDNAVDKNELPVEVLPQTNELRLGNTTEGVNDKPADEDTSFPKKGSEKVAQEKLTSWAPGWVNVENAVEVVKVGSVIIAAHTITKYAIHKLIHSAMYPKVVAVGSGVGIALVNMVTNPTSLFLTNQPENPDVRRIENLPASSGSTIPETAQPKIIAGAQLPPGHRTTTTRGGLSPVATDGSNALSGPINPPTTSSHGHAWLRPISSCEFHADPEALARLSEKLAPGVHSLAGDGKDGNE